MAGQPPTLQYVDFPIFNALIPKEGPKVVPFNFDWNTQNTYAVDLQNAQSRDFISMVQTIWVDNSLNDFPLSIRFDIVGQNLKAPPRWQGYFPVMVVNPPRFIVSSVGSTQSTQIGLMNVPFPAASWSSQQASGNFDPNGNMLVSDIILEGAVSGGLYQNAPFIMGNNNVRVPKYSASAFLAGTVTAAGPTVVLAAGGSGVNFFISAIDISLTGDADLGAPGNLTIELQRSGSMLARKTVTLPITAGSAAIIPLWNMSGLDYLGATANQALQIDLSAALTSGELNYNVMAGYTSILRP